MWRCLAYSALLYIVGFVHFQECKAYLFIERYIIGSSSEDIMINAGISRICFMLAFLIICFIRLQIWHLQNVFYRNFRLQVALSGKTFVTFHTFKFVGEGAGGVILG